MKHPLDCRDNNNQTQRRVTMSDDIDLEPCPGCERPIDIMRATCPHCKYDLTGTAPPPKKPKTPKEPKARKQTQESGAGESGAGEADLPIRSGIRSGHSIMVPALGRMGGKSIDFAELHWKKNEESTDENLREWADNLRDAWPNKVESQGYLSNHAVGLLARDADGTYDAVLRQCAERIVELLGGDDYR